MKSRCWLTLIALFFVLAVKAQTVALKTNFVYWATSTPNIGLELQTSRQHSVQLFYGLNPWKFSDTEKPRHWVLQPEWRHWFCQAFNGWFVGVHAMGGQFNVAGDGYPMSILSWAGVFKDLDTKRYEGNFVGGGITAGYQWPIAKHWNFEASIGVGYDYIWYDRFACGECGSKDDEGHTHYFGPTKAALSLMYVF